MDTFLVVSEVLIILFASFAFLYCVAIVWRVEGELDSSYKCFAFAILAFIVAEVLSVYYSQNESLLIIEMASRLVFSALLLAGIVYMRDIVKHIDRKDRKRVKK